ncbi:hypothetical protein KIN20_000303 [Parelaphostrongylus tenuis]|uniref:Uncharacterized protein n=1 Tax=Parelaphostrongylus tenuis TaxID=148309 RepID=A0AAD5MD29_PARTN|nr:hypothetical protein KIN20_000303 [Parelaphostrongylus tenuis]
MNKNDLTKKELQIEKARALKEERKRQRKRERAKKLEHLKQAQGDISTARVKSNSDSKKKNVNTNDSALSHRSKAVFRLKRSIAIDISQDAE